MGTTNLNLTTYDNAHSGSILFYNYVDDISGSKTTSNMQRIDTFAGQTSTSTTNLSASIVTVGTNLSASIVALSASIVFAPPTQVTAGSSNSVMVSASGLAHSDYGKRTVILPLNTTASLAGGEVNYARIPSTMNNWYLIEGAASVSASCSSGSPTFAVARASASSPDSGSVAMIAGIYIKGAGYDSSTSGCSVTISGSKVLTGDRIKVTATTSASPATYAQVSLTFQNLP